MLSWALLPVSHANIISRVSNAPENLTELYFLLEFLEIFWKLQNLLEIFWLSLCVCCYYDSQFLYFKMYQ